VTDVTDALVCFQQSLGMATPYELRCLFVSLTLLLELHRELMLDWLIDGINFIQANNELFKEIQRRLTLDDKTPEPTRVNTELQRELLQYDPHLELQKFESLQAEYQNNQDQQHVFDAILEAAHVGRKTFFFIDGRGGTGKTTVIK
jgi:hypothetical protein